MIRRDILSWWFRPSFLQPWGRPSDTLFAGPWLGEFGWELMNWQAYLRFLAPKYSRVIVSCRPGCEFLYSDFSNEFVLHQIRGIPECNIAHNVVRDINWYYIHGQIPYGADHLPTVGWQPNHRKKFVPLTDLLPNKATPNLEGKDSLLSSELVFDVLFHPRGRNFGTDRNWPIENWEKLVSALSGQGLKLACIGLSGATLPVQGNFVDLRDQSLEITCTAMKHARLVVGPSSGPMHLATLCRTPHLVWTDHVRYARGLYNRDKYEYAWNPFKTPVKVLDSWGFLPPFEEVLKAVNSFLTVKNGVH